MVRVMGRTLACGALLFAIAGCDDAPAPLRTTAGKTLEACFAKRQLNPDVYLIAATVEFALMLCHDRMRPDGKLDDMAISNAALLSQYVAEETRGAPCADARLSVIKPVQDRMVGVYKKDGEDKFCAWVRQARDHKSDELWTRFWQ